MSKRTILLSGAIVLSSLLVGCNHNKIASTELSSTMDKEKQSIVKVSKEPLSSENKNGNVVEAIKRFSASQSLKVSYKDGLEPWTYEGIISYDVINNKFIMIEQNKQGKQSVYYDRKNDEFFTVIDGQDVSDDYTQSIPLVQTADRRVESIMNIFKILSANDENNLTKFETIKSGEYQYNGRISALANAVKATSTDNGKNNVKNIDGQDLKLLLKVNQQDEIEMIKIEGHIIINYKDGSSEEGTLNTEYMISNYNKTGVQFEKATKDKYNEATSTIIEQGHQH